MSKKQKNIEINLGKPEKKPIICIREVNENIRRVETDQPLTRSLSVLNTNCEFRKKYEEMDMIMHEKEIKKEKKEKNIEYREKHKEYYKEYQRKYYQIPEVKAKKREYNKKYKDRIKKYQRKWYLKLKLMKGGKQKSNGNNK